VRPEGLRKIKKKNHLPHRVSNPQLLGLYHCSLITTLPLPHNSNTSLLFTTVSFQILSNLCTTLPFLGALWSSFVKQLKENGSAVGVGGKSSWASFLKET
jgi:hypothetical protein